MHADNTPVKITKPNKFFFPLTLFVSGMLTLFSISAYSQGVLLVSSSELTGDFQSTVDTTVVKALQESGQKLDYYREDLSMVTDFEMFDKDSWVEAINRKYVDAQIVRVIGVGPFGRFLVEQTHTKLLPNAIKYDVSGSKVIKYDVSLPPEVLSEAERTVSTLNVITKLMPETQKIVLISGDPKIPALIPNFLESSSNGISIELWGLDKSYADILKDSSTLDSEVVILFSGMLVDRVGDKRSSESFMEELYAVANRPIFTTWNSPLGYGAVGGALVEPKKVGLNIADLFMNNFSEQGDLLSLEFDQQVFTRWDLDPSLLPSNVEFINTPTTFWEDIDRVIKYSSFALICLMLVAVLLGIRSWILGNRAKVAEEAAEKLRLEKAKSQTLFGVVAHELRTPVSAIAMMTADSEKVEDSQKDLIHQTTQDLLSTIDDMSLMINPDLIRPIRLSISTIDVFNETIKNRVGSIVSSSGFRFSQTRELSNEYLQSDLITDFYRVRVAITNLIRNACLHSHGTHVVLINRSGVDASTGEPYLEWEVQDNGVGIDVDEIDRLFRAQERGDTQAKGSGLGLYITKNLIEEINGDVFYQRAKEGGSRFFVRVPIKFHQLEHANSERIEPSSMIELKQLRVLLVEDEATLRLLGKTLIDKVVASVDVAVDGQDALSKFDPSFDVVFTDYFMPEINGVALTKTLREQGYEGLIIGVTAATIGNQIDELWQAGCDEIISKPLTLEKVKSTLYEQLAKPAKCDA